MTRDVKILNKMLANQSQEYISPNQMGFIPVMQGWFNIENQLV